MLNAVESLYQDQLKPYGRILRKRLAEKAAGMGFANLDVDIKRVLLTTTKFPLKTNLIFFFGSRGFIYINYVTLSLFGGGGNQIMQMYGDVVGCPWISPTIVHCLGW